jgi:hypothetical protein
MAPVAALTALTGDIGGPPTHGGGGQTHPIGAIRTAPARTYRAVVRRLANVLRPVAVLVALLVWYYTAPLNRPWSPRMALAVLAGILVVGAVMAWQVRAVLVSPSPRLRAISALVTSLPLIIVLFAAAYVVMSHDREDAFSEPLSRIDGLYFATTVFATVGFGDIVPRSQPARVLVLVQMLADLVYVGLLARALFEAARAATTRPR